jgi:hypothetical protein
MWNPKYDIIAYQQFIIALPVFAKIITPTVVGDSVNLDNQPSVTP